MDKKKELILPVTISKNGQKRITLPKNSDFKQGEYVKVSEVG